MPFIHRKINLIGLPSRNKGILQTVARMNLINEEDILSLRLVNSIKFRCSIAGPEEVIRFSISLAYNYKVASRPRAIDNNARVIPCQGGL